ncbi:MAG: acetate--CoA ligase family protein, partial [Candidatus Bathyarchaeota archaeon]|nr:acetate--CoA ligase family protein [Candidatus Bathyarchaeota archaeon]
MKLYEYEAKEIFSKYGMPTPKGELATSSKQARDIAMKLGLPVAVKAQALVSGRGKAGGILFANSSEETEVLTRRLLNTEIKSTKVQSV